MLIARVPCRQGQALDIFFDVKPAYSDRAWKGPDISLLIEGDEGDGKISPRVYREVLVTLSPYSGGPGRALPGFGALQAHLEAHDLGGALAGEGGWRSGPADLEVAPLRFPWSDALKGLVESRKALHEVGAADLHKEVEAAIGHVVARWLNGAEWKPYEASTPRPL